MIRCTNCSASLPDEFFNTRSYTPCPICQSLIRADVFPAAYKTSPEVTSGELLLMNDEASCFYHSNKQAVTTCSQCGRFLCSLCDVDFNGQHMCISCVESGRKKGKIAKLEDRRIRYDNIVLGLAILPIFTLYFTLLTAPAAIFLAIRYWNKPSGINKKGRLRMLFAILISLVQIAVWATIVYSIITHVIR